MNYENKRKIIDVIESNLTPVHQRGSIRISIRCPYCGDSQKDLKHTHCYIKYSYDEQEPMFYKCFLCNKKGCVDINFLKKCGINDKDAFDLLTSSKYNVLSRKEYEEAKEDLGTVRLDSNQVKYINSRLGDGFTKEDYERFRIVWSIDALSKIINNKKILNTLPSNKNSISFLSEDNSLLLTRSFEEMSNGSQWKKVRLKPGIQFYTIRSTFDLFTKDPIYLNIAEGVFDIISVYKNFTNTQNSAFIASLGSDYTAALDDMIHRGIIGKNVVVNVYMDNGIDEKQLKKSLIKYKWMFNSIHIIHNSKSKDVGVKIDDIFLVDNRI